MDLALTMLMLCMRATDYAIRGLLNLVVNREYDLVRNLPDVYAIPDGKNGTFYAKWPPAPGEVRLVPVRVTSRRS